MFRLKLPAVDRDGSLLAELFLCFVDLSDEVDETFAGLWNALLWPIGELKERKFETCKIRMTSIDSLKRSIFFGGGGTLVSVS